MIDNPYETPATHPHGKESRRDLWRRQLICPRCQQAGISAGIAYLAHPFFKVRCNNCLGRSRVRLMQAARKRLFRFYFAATIAGIWALAFLILVDEFTIYTFMDERLPGILGTVFKSWGLDWQMGIVLSLMALISVIPLLVLFPVITRVCLRDVAYHATLIPLDKRL